MKNEQEVREEQSDVKRILSIDDQEKMSIYSNEPPSACDTHDLSFQ